MTTNNLAPCLMCGEPIYEDEPCPSCSTSITEITLTFIVKATKDEELPSAEDFRQALAAYLEDDLSGPYDGAEMWIVAVEDEAGNCSVLAPGDFERLPDPQRPGKVEGPGPKGP